MSRLIAYATPVFIALLLLELHLTKTRLPPGARGYERRDTWASLSMGLANVVIAALAKGGALALFFAAYEWRVFELGTGAAAWLLLFVAEDFCYYWFHRFHHEVRFLWAAHVNHHSSRHFNLSTALRQSWTTPFTGPIFWVPLALLGFHPFMILTAQAASLIYQFWIHTELIGRLGPLEWVLNTPSHHRVHHGRNPRYIDKNHGGTLIVWDRLFGTFAEEREEPVYGITKPLASFNPLWANLHYWVEMWDVARRTARPFDRLRVLWAAPGWRPADLGGPLLPPEVDRASYVKFEVPLAGSRKRYVLAQLVLVLLAATPYLLQSGSLGVGARVLGAALIAWSVVCFGALLDRRPWAALLENVRLAALALGAAVTPGPPLARGAVVVLACASAAWLNRGPQKALPMAPELR
jgi:sterol desaturase/sphingolipid hydroxylase (fatty acid hydroxylase superfamily)